MHRRETVCYTNTKGNNSQGCEPPDETPLESRYHGKRVEQGGGYKNKIFITDTQLSSKSSGEKAARIGIKLQL